jgi:hypothetical protein
METKVVIIVYQRGMEIKVVIGLLLHPRELASTVVGLDGSIDRSILKAVYYIEHCTT